MTETFALAIWLILLALAFPYVRGLPPRRLAPAEVQRELLRQGANLRELAPG